MMFSNHSVHTVVALLLSSIGQVQQVHAQNRNWNGRATPVTCSICGDANRPILNPTQSFTMNNGITWTCDYLQETVQDVDPNASYENERMMCVQAQLEGEKGGCQCGFASTTIDNIQFPVPQLPDVIPVPVPTPSPVAVPILLPTPSPVAIPVSVPPTPSPVLSLLAKTTTPTATFQPTTPFPPTEQSPFSAPTPSLITESTGVTSAPSRRVVSSSNRPSARGGSSNSSTRSGRPSSSGSDDKGSGKSGSGKSGGKSGSGKSGKSSSPSSASGTSRRSNGGAADNDEVLLRSSEYAFVSSSPTTTSYTTIAMIALVSSVGAAFLL